MIATALQLVASVCAEFSAQVETCSGNRAVFLLQLKLADGTTIPYHLEVTSDGDRLSVRELAPNNLPGFCPQRHINGDGTFCLYWAAEEGLVVTTDVVAREWWRTVWKYLKQQARVTKLRKWPDDAEWAHGEAARYQKQALEAASRLGGAFEEALQNSEVVVKTTRARRYAQRLIAQVFVYDQHLYSVWLDSDKVVNRKQRCFCGSSGNRKPARLKACHDHAEDAVKLAQSKLRWEEKENEFWAALKGRQCCGTTDICPLKDGP